ncbi:MAG: hypothetical protein H3C31_10135 [Brumimicrobium sp.]|nr:hypothetical protein [Brumimicrobium sp.]
MIRKLFLLIILSVSTTGFGQIFGNEWVNYSQQYYKFPIVQDGIYRIYYNDLVMAGFPINAVFSNQIQIFGKQREVPLNIEDNGDNKLNPGEYIEFFAQRNDGWLDSLLYNQPTDIGNPAYSLYSDTLYYFITWTNGPTKRIIKETDSNYSIYTAANFILQKVDVNYNSEYFGGYSQSAAYASSFSPGEGWGGPNYNGASGFSLTIPLATPEIYTGTGSVNTVFHAKSNANSNAAFTGVGNHHIRWEIGSSNFQLYDEIFVGFRQTVVNTTFPTTSLNNGNTNLYFKIIGDQAAATDYQSVSYVSIKYPRKTIINGTYLDWEVINSPLQAKVRLDITNTGFNQPIAIVMKGGITRMIPLVNNGGIWQGLIPNSSNGANQRLIIQNASTIAHINNITPVNGTGYFHNYTVDNVEGAYIILYNKAMQNSVNQYKSYRTSVNGGSHNVLLVEMNDAWMQYGGGVPKHVLGSKRALHHIYFLAGKKPEALFIAGKGVTESSDPNTASGNTPRKNSIYSKLNLVPSYGNPSSDLGLTSGWDNASIFAPLIPTGRVAAQNDSELTIYLNKVQVFEAAQNQNGVYNKPLKDWQKQVIHFGGGGNTQEQNILKSYLNGMKNTIEGNYFGGNVTSFFKQTTEPFNPLQTSQVNQLLENGVSLINFFGHAVADGFDQNIDEPSAWGNTGKYPFVIGNGCYSGDIFTAGNTSNSERMVMIEDLGAIGFISSSKLGFASYLNLYTSELYKQISTTNYGGTIGEQVMKTAQIMESQFNSFIVEMTAQQMVLHADPGIHINWHKKPEIDLTVEDISFSPNQISLTTDSIAIQVVLTNLGKSITDTFNLTIQRHFPQSSIDSIYNLSVNGLDYKDTIIFKMPLQVNIGGGMNVFSVKADIPSFVPEQYDEYGNNQTSANLFVNIDGILPVWPADYAVVPKDSVVVKASTINPIAPFRTYRFEIDTTDLYNSPFKKYATISGLGGVKEVFPNEWKSALNGANSPLLCTDSTVYYWRVAVDSSVLNWNEHTFQYIPHKRGWGQSHFFQYKNNNFNSIKYDRPTRKRYFNSQDVEITAKVYDNSSSTFEYSNTLWQLNGQNVEYGICTTTPSFHVGVVSPVANEPWGTAFNGLNSTHQFGNVNGGSACRNRVEYFFIFRQNDLSQIQAFENMIENEIPDGYYVVIYTSMYAMYSTWQSLYPNLFNLFSNIGAVGISPTSPERAFILIYKKGDPSSAQIVHAQNSKEFIQLTKTFDGSLNQGVETSTVIGPANTWGTVYWKQTPEETPTKDYTRLLIKGLDIDQNVGITIDTLFSSNDSILNLNSLIPAQNYPYLQLQAIYEDTTQFTPAQINRWHVLYEDVPEAAIDGTNGYVFLPKSKDSLMEGVTASFAIDVKNISDLDMDSLLIHYWINDQYQTKHILPYPRQDSLRVSQVLRDTIQFSTVGMAGNNILWMEVNPYTKGANNEYTDQPELAHFNNLLQLPFNLGFDDINPILDVTFDGDHILNGDIVNPQSEIVITLKDENPFLVMSEDADTANFGIYLTTPSGIQKRVPFLSATKGQVMEWIPATPANLRFKILYTGDFKEEGTYMLLVQGIDKAGNLSGKFEYRVKFEVILKSTITHLMNYPNPFSTKTQFVFTLTGSEVPDDMMIRIMTVTGRVVREISMDELGPIKIGRNITEYAWDGRDEFGDLLANGVYLYHVVARINGEDIEHRKSGADKFFKKNWGKMYLMR